VPFLEARGLRIHYELTGPPQAPVVVFSNSLGADLSMWDPQVPALAVDYRVLRYDTRGHGQTAVTDGPYAIPQLAGDVLGLLDGLGIARVHFCGLSMGGLIGMWLGSQTPARLERLVLCNTGAVIGTAERWNGRIQEVRDQGMPGLAPSVLERWFTPGFRERSPEVVARTRAMVEGAPAAGYIACAAAIRDADLRAALPSIRAATMVVSGRWDPATPPSDGQAIARAVPGARYLELDSSHLSNVEAAADFTAALLGFLAG
jgi:3-oxoadipate enol-lactonase